MIVEDSSVEVVVGVVLCALVLSVLFAPFLIALSRGRSDSGIIFLMCVSWPVLAILDMVLPLGDIIGLVIWVFAWKRSLSSVQYV